MFAKQSGTTYGALTIRKAIDGCSNVYIDYTSSPEAMARFTPHQIIDDIPRTQTVPPQETQLMLSEALTSQLHESKLRMNKEELADADRVLQRFGFHHLIVVRRNVEQARDTQHRAAILRRPLNDALAFTGEEALHLAMKIIVQVSRFIGECQHDRLILALDVHQPKNQIVIRGLCRFGIPL